MAYKYSRISKTPEKVSNLGQKGYPRAKSVESTLQGFANTRFKHDPKTGHSVPATRTRTIAQRPLAPSPAKLKELEARAHKNVMQKHETKKMAIKAAVGSGNKATVAAAVKNAGTITKAGRKKK